MAAETTGGVLAARPDKSSPRADVEFRRDGDDLIFTWTAYKLTATFSRLRQRTDGLGGELLLSHRAAGRLYWGHLSLASPSARKTLADKLKRDIGTDSVSIPNWNALLDNLCYMAAREFRTDGSFVQVGACDEPEQRTSFLVPPLLLTGEVNMLFGNSGVGKGYLAAALALAVHSRLPVLGLPVPDAAAPTLYLDWEWSAQEANRRLLAICRGIESPRQAITYRRMVGALADQIDVIRAEMRRRGIEFVIIDSLQMACGVTDGGDPAGEFIRVMQALRSLETTTLLVDHPSKGVERGAETPYGTRYKLALCRNIWLARKSHGGPGQLHVGLWHDENSNVAHQPPLGFRLTFTMDAMDPQVLRSLTFHREDVRDVDGFTDLLTDWQRIERLLKQEALNSKALAERIDKSDEQVRARLNERLKRGQVIKLPDGRWALTDQGHRE